MFEQLVITNHHGKRFTVRAVRRGEGYGVGDKIIHDSDDSLIEFYDLDHAERFGPLGQFVSRYYASTLAHHSDDTGLSLDGGIPAWSIDRGDLPPVLDLARTLHGTCADPSCTRPTLGSN